MIRIMQRRSAAGKVKNQRRTLESLGLRRIGHIRDVQDNPAIRGMINTVAHLITVISDPKDSSKNDQKAI